MTVTQWSLRIPPVNCAWFPNKHIHLPSAFRGCTETHRLEVKMRQMIVFVWIAFGFVTLFEVAQKHLEVSEPIKNIFISFQQIPSHFSVELKR